MATRSLAVLGLALAGTLGCVSVAGAARNGPIAGSSSLGAAR